MKELDVRKSLYAPIEIAIKDKNGKRVIYKSIKFSKPNREIVEPITKRIMGGERNAAYDWVKAVYLIPDEVIDALESWEIEDIYVYTCRELSKEDGIRSYKTVKGLQDALDEAKQAAGLSPKKPKAKRTTVKNRKRSGSKK